MYHFWRSGAWCSCRFYQGEGYFCSVWTKHFGSIMLPATTMILFHNHQSFVSRAVCQSHVKTSNRRIRIISPWLRTFQQLHNTLLTFPYSSVRTVNWVLTYIKLLHLFIKYSTNICIELCIFCKYLSFSCVILNQCSSYCCDLLTVL